MTYFFGFLHRHEWEPKSEWETKTSEPEVGFYRVVNNVMTNNLVYADKVFVNKEFVCKECGETKIKIHLKSETIA